MYFVRIAVRMKVKEQPEELKFMELFSFKCAQKSARRNCVENLLHFRCLVFCVQVDERSMISWITCLVLHISCIRDVNTRMKLFKMFSRHFFVKFFLSPILTLICSELCNLEEQDEVNHFTW